MQLDQEALKRIYAENYFKGEEYADYLADRLILQHNFNKRLNHIQRLKPTLSHVLEIGCAYGFFAEVLLRKKPDAHYNGYDISSDAIAYANQHYGAHFSDQNFLDSASESEKYSDCFMWDVIEHLADPSAFIQKIAQESTGNARIYLTTGDIGSWLARKQGPNWRMIHPPSHLHYFTRQSMGKLLEKAGYQIEQISYPPVSRSLRVIYYSLFLLNKKASRLHQWIYKCIPERAAIRINTRDIFFIVAKKMTP
ncbi:MAG: hypothetical protein RLZZ301_1646 [Bacteroidota bacterium]|jgi:SAM-dependent methyltransferase